MTEEKKGIERMVRNKKLVDVTASIVLILALALMFSTLPMLFTIGDMVKTDHLTNPSIPAKDLENATYTYTAHELLKMVYLPIYVLFGGLAFMLGSLVMVYVNPSDKDLHIAGCKGDGDKKYSPECGLKLSRLEKD